MVQANPTTRIRAARLVRVSTKQQAGEDRTSLVVQTQQLTDLCRDRGWDSEDGDLFVEVISGGKGLANRLVLSGLLDRIAEGYYQRLCVLDFDRTTRKGLGEWEQFGDILAASGCAIVINGQEYDMRQSGSRLVTDVQAAVAKFERKRISERVTRGLEEKAANGTLMIGKVPYGYRSHFVTSEKGRPERRIEVDPVESPTVARVFDLYASGTVGTQKIATILNAEGRRWKDRKTGDPVTFLWWHVQRMLRNPIYCGIYVRRRHYTSHAQTQKLPPVVADSKLFDPIVSREVWEACQAIATGRPTSRRPPSGYKHPLSGILKCKACGDAMMAHYASDKTVSGETRKRLSYRCYRRQRDRGVCGREQTVAMGLAHAATRALLRQILEFDLPLPRSSDDSHERRLALQAELATLERQEAALLALVGLPVESGGIRPDQLARSNLRILHRRDAIDRELAELSGRAHRAAKIMTISPGQIANVLHGDDEALGAVVRTLFTDLTIDKTGHYNAKIVSATLITGDILTV